MVEFSDLRRHAPGPDSDATWQESCFLGWYDPQSNCGGHHRIGLRPGRNDAVVWSTLVMDGQVSGRSQHLSAPLPDGDYDDLQAGSLRVRFPSLREVRLEAQFPKATLVLDYTAICDPVEQHWNVGGLVLAKRHYETMGLAKGVLTAGEREIPLLGRCWHDHSWGPRTYYAHRAGRWLFAVFGDDLAISAFTYSTPDGRRSFGWVHDDGRLLSIENAQFRGVVDDDGLTPIGCDATIDCEGGRSYRVRGEVQAAALVGDGDWWAMEGMATYECGGRKGAGMLELNELKTLHDGRKRELGFGG